MKPALLEALQLLALRAVESPNWDDFYYSVCRWYSKTFHTPLHQVRSVPKADVMRAWYEEHYEELLNSEDDKKVERYHEIRDSIVFKEELAEREQEDAAWEQEMIDEVAAAEQEQGIQQLESEPLGDPEPNLIAEQGNFLFDDSIPEF